MHSSENNLATSKPRITITLSDQQHAVLSALAKLQKVSMSSIIVDLVDTTLPVLQRLSEVLQNASTAPQSVLDEIKRSAEQAESDLSSAGSSVMEQLDFLVAASSGPATKRSARVGPEGAAKVRPPTSNRGVRNVPLTSKIDSILPMKKGEKNGRAEK